MTDKHFIDWEAYTFGYGYGTGEAHTLKALLDFFSTLEHGNCYDYRRVEAVMGETAAWLLINVLCGADVLSYGTSARLGWLTVKGEALRDYLSDKTADSLYDSVMDRDGDYCEPEFCNCDEGNCDNPMWRKG